MIRYPRDMRGHGPKAPDPKWPNGAKIAVQFVLNYEEGGENCILHGDAASEAFLSDISGATQWPGQRHRNMESIYEYGARAGFWRLHRLFTESGIPVTIFGVATALARSPEQVQAMKDAGWEIASHGLKWIDHKDMQREEERATIAEAISLHAEVVGQRPRGWYTGRCSAETVRLVAEEGGFDYISDVYDDDLPHWIEVGGRSQLVIPYTLEANDMRFAAAPGYTTGQQFFEYLKDTFDILYAEGNRSTPKMMSIGLHCRLIGRPGKIAGLARFIEYINSFEHVWCPRRIDIADHWAATHPHLQRRRPSEMSKVEFVAAYGSAFAHAPWIAERAHDLEFGPAHDCAAGVHNALCRSFRRASRQEQLDVLREQSNPQSRRPTIGSIENSSVEKAFERQHDLATLATLYYEKHGFPLFAAIYDTDLGTIAETFRRRIANDTNIEFSTVCSELEQLARTRLEKMIP